jgi:single-stranded-DNA-specific exonuclease
MWPVRDVDRAAVADLARQAGVSELVARLFWLRGVRDAEAAHRWLAPDVGHLHPPELLPDFAPATARIRRALAAHEPILIWGHDDLDGITSTVILCRLLTDLRGDVRFHIPQKGRDKHGIDAEIALRHAREGVKLVITVDCGITNRRQVEDLRAAGVDVIVTDHHEVTEPMPDAVANVDPKRPDSRYPFRGLAGAGVALKLAMGLAREMVGVAREEFFSIQPQLVVLGTLADRVPLVDENRTLVALGLRKLETVRLPAVRAVFEYLNATEKLTVHSFVHELLPLFAAANGADGVRRFLGTGAEDAQSWVEELARRREDWRQESDRTYELALRNLVVGDGVVFAHSRELSLRALGFCANRIKDRFQMPSIVIGWRGDAWVGEGRGVEGMSLMDLLSACSEYFIDYGGHRKAAGFSMEEGKLDGFLRCAEAYAHQNLAGRLVPENAAVADALLQPEDFEAAVLRLSPFGDGNPQPLFAARAAELVPGSHGWSPASRPDVVLRPGRFESQLDSRVAFDLLYTLDDFGRLTIVDARPCNE